MAGPDRMIARLSTASSSYCAPGTPWRDLPERYGPYTTVYNRFNRWAKVGIWLRIFEALAARSPQSMQLIDSSIIRAHQHAAGGKRGPDHAIGRSCEGLNTKINAVVDQQGIPVRIVLSRGQSETCCAGTRSTRAAIGRAVHQVT
jgi:transposase